MRITIFRSMEEAEETWRAAEADCVLYGFQSFDWLSTWMKTIGIVERVQPVIVVISADNRQTMMLLPLGIEVQGHAGICFLRFLGGVVTDYQAPLINADFAARLDRSQFNALWSDVLGRLPEVDIVALSKMPETIEHVPNPFLWLPGVAHTSESFAARLETSFETFSQRRNAKFMSQTRRKRRRLASVGRVTFEIPTDPSEAKAVVRIMLS